MQNIIITSYKPESQRSCYVVDGVVAMYYNSLSITPCYHSYIIEIHILRRYTKIRV